MRWHRLAAAVLVSPGVGRHPNGTSVTHATPQGIPSGQRDAGDEDVPPGPTSAADAAEAREATDDAPPLAPAPVAGGWLAWAVGTRVVVRRRLPEGGYGDVLGDLLEVGPDGVVVGTRRGPVRVAAADIALGKPVPPAPPRRAPRAAAAPAPAPDDVPGAGEA